jgi:hypothetical protein
MTMTLLERIEKLTPRQRQAIDLVVTLFLLSNEAESLDDAEGVFTDTLDLFHALIYDEQERDFGELRRVLRYGMAHALRALETSPNDLDAQAHLLVWQLYTADIDMAWYLHTGDQAFRRSAISRFDEMVRILTKQPQTWYVREAIDHARTFSRRLSTKYKEIEPTSAEDALHLCKYYDEKFTLRGS